MADKLKDLEIRVTTADGSGRNGEAKQDGTFIAVNLYELENVLKYHDWHDRLGFYESPKLQKLFEELAKELGISARRTFLEKLDGLYTAPCGEMYTEEDLRNMVERVHGRWEAHESHYKKSIDGPNDFAEYVKQQDNYHFMIEQLMADGVL